VPTRLRIALGVIASLLVLAGAMVVNSQPSRAGATRVAQTAAPAVAPTTVPPSTTTTVAPTTTTTAASPAPAPARRAPVTTVAPSVTVAPAPAPVVRQTSSRETCQWGWDATRIDDGSLDEVVITLMSPRRPNAPVTVTAAPHGPTTVPTVRLLTTDGSGNASTTVTLSEDKRDWTVTVSAVFVGGGTCAAQTFTITYN